MWPVSPQPDPHANNHGKRCVGSGILDWSDARRVRWLSELAEALDALSTTAGVSEHVRTAAAGGHPTRGNPILDGERTYPWFIAGRELNAQGLHAHALAMLRLVPVFGDRTVPVLYETGSAWHPRLLLTLETRMEHDFYEWCAASAIRLGWSIGRTAAEPVATRLLRTSPSAARFKTALSAKPERIDGDVNGSGIGLPSGVVTVAHRR